MCVYRIQMPRRHTNKKRNGKRRNATGGKSRRNRLSQRGGGAIILMIAPAPIHIVINQLEEVKIKEDVCLITRVIIHNDQLLASRMVPRKYAAVNTNTPFSNDLENGEFTVLSSKRGSSRYKTTRRPTQNPLSRFCNPSLSVSRNSWTRRRRKSPHPEWPRPSLVAGP